jgi:hypothetical protein
MDDIDHMDGRAAALILSALIDNTLEYVIRARFVPLNKSNFDALFRNPTAPLSSLSAKIALAHAMGIVGDELRIQLNRLRSIRNAFAHAMVSVSFDDPEIVAECKKLDPQSITRGKFQPEDNTPRERFTAVGTAALTILLRYMRHAHNEVRYGANPWSRPPQKF